MPHAGQHPSATLSVLSQRSSDQGYFGLPMHFTLHFRIVAYTSGAGPASQPPELTCSCIQVPYLPCRAPPRNRRVNPWEKGL